MTSPARLALTISAASIAAGFTLALAACASDDTVGHRKTTTKTTVETPTEKKTITETHEKDTRYIPPRN